MLVNTCKFGTIFYASVVGDNDILAKHYCIGQKISLKADKRSAKISWLTVSINDLESLSERSKTGRLIDNNDMLLHNFLFRVSLTNIFSFFKNRVYKSW